MSGFEKIDESTLVNFDLQLVIEEGGLNFELGGTQFIDLFYDPDLTRENVWQEVKHDIGEVKKISSNPQVVADILASKGKSVFRSERRKKVWQLSLFSRESEKVFEWVLDIDTSRRNELIKKIKDALPSIGNADDVAQNIFTSLGGLSCWREVNRRNFETVRIVLSNGAERHSILIMR